MQGLFAPSKRTLVQGLPVQCVCTIKNGRPFGLLNQLGIPNALEERFIDICSGGALLTRYAAKARHAHHCTLLVLYMEMCG